MFPIRIPTSGRISSHGAASRACSDGTRGVPRRGVPEQFGDDDHEEQELDEVQGESGGGDDVVEVPLG